jgi:hypothetical protein
MQKNYTSWLQFWGTLVCFHPCATPPFKGYIRVTHKMGHGSCLLQQIFTNIKNMDMISFICGQYAHVDI